MQMRMIRWMCAVRDEQLMITLYINPRLVYFSEQVAQ